MKFYEGDVITIIEMISASSIGDQSRVIDSGRRTDGLVERIDGDVVTMREVLPSGVIGTSFEGHIPSLKWEMKLPRIGNWWKWTNFTGTGSGWSVGKPEDAMVKWEGPFERPTE